MPQHRFRPAAPLAGAIALIASQAAFATNGYFTHGVGVQSQGLAGAGIALPLDALASATNPAGIAYLGDRVDVGATLFNPDRGATIVGNGYGANGSYDGNGKDYFVLPEAGYVKQLSPQASLGIALYGNGGMNTDYRRNPFAAFGSTGSAGVNLTQAFLSPSFAWKPVEDHAFGVALVVAYQQFYARGLGAFASASIAPGNLSDRHTADSTGIGVRLGWTGRLTPNLTLGATWASKISGSFDKYRGLFADAGNFDIPQNYGLGLAWQAAPGWKLAVDWQHIDYGGVRSIANPLSNLFLGNPLGSANGPGFGWKNVNVYKLGASFDVDAALTLRAGFSHTDEPFGADQTFFNILAPGVVQNHVTFGASRRFGRGELSAFYARALRNTIDGANSIPASFGGGNANVRLSENLLGVAYGWKL